MCGTKREPSPGLISNTCGWCNYSGDIHSENYTIGGGIKKTLMRFIFSLAVAGWFTLEMACLQLVLSLSLALSLSLPLREAADLQIAKPRHSPRGFPAIRADLGFLRPQWWGVVVLAFTLSYVTCHLKRCFPVLKHDGVSSFSLKRPRT